MNQWQQAEADAAERKVLVALFGQEAIPDGVANLMRCFKVDPNKYIKEFERRIEPYMKDNGMIDGRFVSRAVRAWKPKIAELIDIPDEDFRLADIVEPILELLFPNSGRSA